MLKEAGLYRPADPAAAPIMVVPLFETIGDLQNAPQVMQGLVRAAGNPQGRQTPRLSGSDGRLFGFQQGWRLPHLGVEPQPCHACPGAGVRGGADPHADLPWPRRRGGSWRRLLVRRHPRAAAGHGAGAHPDHRAGRGDRRQVRHARKARPRISRPSRRRPCWHPWSPPPHPTRRQVARFATAMDEISATAFNTYRGLVYETEGFKTFFRQMTPLTEIAELKIGSRPASRTKSDRIEDLRAIPWVFSWAQARVMLPGWYGTGQALNAFEDRGLLREMAASWPFFQSTLDNLEMVLAKSDMSIARRYATPGRGPHPGRCTVQAHRDGLEHDARHSAGHHRPDAAAGKASGAGCLDPAAPALYRTLESAAGRVAEASPGRRNRRAGPRRHPAVHQRRGDRTAQQRLMGFFALPC